VPGKIACLSFSFWGAMEESDPTGCWRTGSEIPTKPVDNIVSEDAGATIPQETASPNCQIAEKIDEN
jgi:hypothetical protein